MKIMLIRKQIERVSGLGLDGQEVDSRSVGNIKKWKFGFEIAEKRGRERALENFVC